MGAWQLAYGVGEFIPCDTDSAKVAESTHTALGTSSFSLEFRSCVCQQMNTKNGIECLGDVKLIIQVIDRKNEEDFLAQRLVITAVSE